MGMHLGMAGPSPQLGFQADPGDRVKFSIGAAPESEARSEPQRRNSFLGPSGVALLLSPGVVGLMAPQTEAGKSGGLGGLEPDPLSLLHGQVV